MVRLARLTPPGPFLEVGVYKGGSAQRLYEVAQEQGRALYLFDTFTGIPVKSEVDHHNIGDFADTDLDIIRKELPMARIYVGVFPDSLPGTLIQGIAFVHVDCDQHDSVDACIVRLYPYMVKSGIMLFDDYEVLDGARQAVDHWIDPHEIHKTDKGKAYIIK